MRSVFAWRDRYRAPLRGQVLVIGPELPTLSAFSRCVLLTFPVKTLGFEKSHTMGLSPTALDTKWAAY